LFHASYNGIMLALALAPQFVNGLAARWPNLAPIALEQHDGGVAYRWPVVALSVVTSAAILAWFHRIPFQATKEEQLSDARAHQSQQLVGAPGSAD